MPKTILPTTLAQRVQCLREALGITPNRLAEQTRLPAQLIHDIEAGLETFLAPAIRQRLARALRIKSSVLQEVEQRPQTSDPTILTEEAKAFLLEAVQENPTRKYTCPLCAKPLAVRAFTRLDLDDNPVHVLKINCTTCLFRLETE